MKLKGPASAGGKRLWWHQSILTSLIRKSNLILSNMTVFSFLRVFDLWSLTLPTKTFMTSSYFFLLHLPRNTQSATLWACTWLTMLKLHHDHVMDWISALHSKMVFQKVRYQYPEMLVLPLVPLLNFSLPCQACLVPDFRVSLYPYGRSVLDSIGNVLLKILACLAESVYWWEPELNAMWWFALCTGSLSSLLAYLTASEEPLPPCVVDHQHLYSFNSFLWPFMGSEKESLQSSVYSLMQLYEVTTTSSIDLHQFDWKCSVWMWISWNHMACHSCSASYYSLKTTKRTADLIVVLKKGEKYFQTWQVVWNSLQLYNSLNQSAVQCTRLLRSQSEKLVVWTLGNWTLGMCAACLLLLCNRCKTSRCHKEVHA